MQNIFSIEGPGRVTFGNGSALQLGEEVKLFNAAKALVVVDPMVLEAKVAEGAIQSLEAAGVTAEIFSQITREPEPAEADMAAELARQHGAEVIIGIGGGSALDLAKAVGVLVTNPGKATDYVGLNLVKNPGVPVICLPTTAGTGSEVTFTAVFTRRADGFKGGINGRLLFPKSAILDPMLTITCPSYVTATVGMDALTHAMEAYTSLRSNPISARNAIMAIELIGQWLRPAVANGENLEARGQMMLAAYYAGLALAQAGVGAVHAMAYPLGALFDIPHGEANATLLPYVLGFNMMACEDKMADMAFALSELPDDLSVREAAEACVEEVFSLSEDIGIPSDLTELNVPMDRIPEMAKKAMGVAVPIANNPRKVDAGLIEQIYRRAFQAL